MDLEKVLEILKQVNAALIELDKMGLRLTGVLDLPVMLKALKILQ